MGCVSIQGDNMSIRRALIGITAFTAVSAGSIVMAPAASAVPGCVHVESIYHTFDVEVDVGNGCTYSVWVKVLYAFAPDTPCTEIKPGYLYVTKRARPARFDGIVDC